MTFRALLIAKAAVALFFGALLLAAPKTLFGLLGAPLDAAGAFPAREYGAAMIGITLLCWLGRDVRAPDARGAILLALLVYDGIGVVLTVHGLATHVLNALGWGIVAVYFVFTLGPAYVLAREKPFRRAREQSAG